MSSSKPGISAVILAAGLSSRMGEFKALLPFGRSTVIETVIDQFIAAGVTDIRIIVGHQSDLLLPLLEKLPVTAIENKCYLKGMFSSVRSGVLSFTNQTQAFFLLPVDMPLIKADSLKSIIKTYHKTSAAVIYPVYNQKRGHPPLIDQQCFDAICRGNDDTTLKTVLQAFKHLSVETTVPDIGLTLDMDTPADYEHLKTLETFHRLPD
ncbi:Molybdenum cofactor cytidylyltransferase [anaerobic digester metagenome]